MRSIQPGVRRKEVEVWAGTVKLGPGGGWGREKTQFQTKEENDIQSNLDPTNLRGWNNGYDYTTNGRRNNWV